jgi:hypothetical protein
MDGFEIKGNGTLVCLLPFPKNPQEALEHSIAKWEFIAANAAEVEDDGGTWSCGLCRFFYDKKDEEGRWNEKCGECPVALDGHAGCSGTPYYTAWGDADTEEEIRDAAKAEVEYLEGLRVCI